MDIGLAGEIDGIETARQIRKESAVPVIFLTGHVEMKQIPRIDGIIRSGFIMKPFVEREVLLVIGKALNKNNESRDGVDP
jgi:DNA-binding response OmpR family regulator